ncbi:Serine/threonine-protein kinase HipA [termite gut metagenome]|uniref:Serine/threonine-protein kinase HipA n=1 Tax=termite gut metagenome TaxID=433724 RepID=A0A5J4QRZ5_9ZZZZ
MNKCLYCYQELLDGQTDFHPRCSKKIFGTTTPPELPYMRNQIGELAEQVVRSQTTVTGVQPKLSLDLEGKDAVKRFTIVGLWGKYILKPQTELYPQLPELEDLTMHLAEIAKIKTVPHSLIRFADSELCYITKRIDRDNQGNKLPMEDFCQLSERLTEYKYKGSYEQIAKLILKYSNVPKLDLVNFWEQVIFCWLTGNADMHLKNFSLYSPVKGQQLLTPAYDMLSTALVMPTDKEELALTLNGKKSKIKRNDFEKALLQSGLEPKVIENIFVKFERIIPKWLEFIDKSFLAEQTKLAYKELIYRTIS